MAPLALVTGGTSGLGAAIVRELGQAGHRLAFSYRKDAAGAVALVAELRGQGIEAQGFAADFSDPHAAGMLHDAVCASMGPMQILVNNVGPGAATPLEAVLAARTMSMMQVGLASALDLTHRVAETMAPGGVVLNISSLNGRLPPAGVTGFAASKAALDAATLALAQELGPRGIRVLGIAPGPIERDEAPRPQAVRDKIAAKTALPRLGTPQDVADLAAFLVSDKAGFLTGEIIGLHGGWA